jgi:VanZ family protein
MQAWNWMQRWGPVLLMMGLIFLASSVPSDRMPKVENFDTLVKKGGHMLGYALLGMSLVRAQGHFTLKTFLWACLGTGLYALSDEFHQSFVPGRNATLVDVAIDLTGFLVGQVLLSRVPILKRYLFAR